MGMLARLLRCFQERFKCRNCQSLIKDYPCEFCGAPRPDYKQMMRDKGFHFEGDEKQ
jgi:hypothetical protein